MSQLLFHRILSLMLFENSLMFEDAPPTRMLYHSLLRAPPYDDFLSQIFKSKLGPYFLLAGLLSNYLVFFHIFERSLRFDKFFKKFGDSSIDSSAQIK